MADWTPADIEAFMVAAHGPEWREAVRTMIAEAEARGPGPDETPLLLVMWGAAAEGASRP